jgi:hypothetical protein
VSETSAIAEIRKTNVLPKAGDSVALKSETREAACDGVFVTRLGSSPTAISKGLTAW